jgi:hypothetical protein
MSGLSIGASGGGAEQFDRAHILLLNYLCKKKPITTSDI